MPNSLKLLLADILLVLQVAFIAVIAQDNEDSVPILPAFFKPAFVFVLSTGVLLEMIVLLFKKYKKVMLYNELRYFYYTFIIIEVFLL